MVVTRSSFLLFLFLFFVSCGKKGKPQDKIPDLDSIEMNILEAGEVPQEAQNFSINVQFSKFSKEQENKIQEAIELIKQVVASEGFRDRVLQKKYRGELTYVENNGLTNKNIYKSILLGREILSAAGYNNTMDLELELYMDDTTTTIGYTYPNVTKIWVNQKYLDKNSPKEIADNLFHEWLHKLGFNHSLTYTPSRPHTVPYAIGYLVRELASQFE